MAILTTEDPTLAFRNQPKRQDVFDFTEKIDPKSENFQFWKLFFSFYPCWHLIYADFLVGCWAVEMWTIQIFLNVL